MLLDTATALLNAGRGGVFVDCTLGLGGHALELLSRFPDVSLVGIDRDVDALELARSRLAPFSDRIEIVEGRASELDSLLDSAGVGAVAGIFADLGVSSMQIDQGSRGFSLRRDGPLDMRMGRGDLTAEEIVNTYPEVDLARIIKDYGEEKAASRIARELIRVRSQAAISTTFQLRDVVHRAKRGGVRDRGRKRSRLDPATLVFQALRIEVNAELAELEALLKQSLRRLQSSGRLVVISYHSLEDRLVKNILRDAERGDVDLVTGRSRSETQILEVLTRRPLRPGAEEVSENPRARSARLRAARRL